MSDRPDSKSEARVWVVEPGQSRPRTDQVATEEPLEIRLRAAGIAADAGPLAVFRRRSQGAGQRTVAITMRTPGADVELAAGFLYGEGIIRRGDEISGISHCDEPDLDEDKRYNIVNVDLRSDVLPDLQALERHFYTTSACGVCGKASLESLRLRGCPAIPAGPEVDAEVLRTLPERLRAGQGIFDATGGLHAAALFDPEGNLLAVREDVGRHNALDKVVGWALLGGRLPLSRHIVMVSGRSSFEILQKSLMAGVPIVCAVSAPSSLAVSLAREFGITLIGFLRGDRFNVYSGLERVQVGVPLPR
ncbi:MAG: formate dehydrogenase accessory sulfurtransferase FdhD [Acidobacteria bacterium]|nr:MAG: formate dehydrogenase accessory sulfurtransferase FdhD [Acidobacteriota bacterium]